MIERKRLICGDIVLDVPLSITILYLLCLELECWDVDNFVDAMMVDEIGAFVSAENVTFGGGGASGLIGVDMGINGWIGAEEEEYN